MLFGSWGLVMGILKFCREVQERRTKRLGARLREYAENEKHKAQSRGRIFSESELADVLGTKKHRLSAVMRYLEEGGHARRSFVSASWEIDRDDVSKFP